MGWIKRNLFFVIGGVLALGLLGVAGFFIYSGWSRNAEKSHQLNEIYDQLKQISVAPQQPGNSRIDNTKIAREQEQQMRGWIQKSAGYFQPIPRIPQGDVTSKTYATALGDTIYALQQEAKESSITLPPNYFFSFQVQSSKLTLSPNSLGPLAAQLGEVKAIADILIAARVNDLDGIQRVRVSDDDNTDGLQSDYTDAQPMTNSLAIITPYVITFRTFTPNLAKVMSGFATSPNSFIVKTVSVRPSGLASTPEAGAPNRLAPGMLPWQQPNGQPPPAGPPAGKGGLQTILKEQLLRIVLEVDIVKLLPGS
jgi:hypothetical protein